MIASDAIVECETCRTWCWSAAMRPAYVAGKWHHPSHAMEVQIIAVVPMVRLPSGKLAPILRTTFPQFDR